MSHYAAVPQPADRACREWLASANQPRSCTKPAPATRGAAPASGIAQVPASASHQDGSSPICPPDRAARSGRAAAAIKLAHPGLPGSWCELAVDMHEAAGETVKAAELRLELGRRALQSGAFASATRVLTTARTLLEGERSVPDRLVVDIDNAIARASS